MGFTQPRSHCILPVDDPADGRGVEEGHRAAEDPVEHVVVHLPRRLQSDHCRTQAERDKIELVIKGNNICLLMS